MTAAPRRVFLFLAVVLGFSVLSGSAADNTVCTDTSVQAAQRPGVAHTVTVEGHPFALWSKSPAAPKGAVLLVHGRTWSGRPDFDLTAGCEDLSLMNGLVAAGYAAYAVDMRGYGSTPRDHTGWLTPNRAAADLAGVLEWLNARVLAQTVNDPEPKGPRPAANKAHLFGWSYGSTIAQLMVQQRPELAASLTLFGYPVRKGYSETPADLPQTAPAKPNTRKNAVSDFITPNSISPAAINAFAAAALAADPVRTDWRKLEQWSALDGRRVSVPTLLLQGEFDPLARKRIHRKLIRRVNNNNKDWVVIQGGDHAAFMEAPRDRFISAFTTFLEQHSRPTDGKNL